MKEILSKVVAGDEDAEQTLNLRPIRIAPARPRITRLNLQLAHKQHSEIAAAAKALKFPLLEECAMANVAHTMIMYKSITKEDLKPEVVEPQDYSQTILAVLKEIEESIGMKKVWGSADEEKSEVGDIDTSCSESGDVDESVGGKALRARGFESGDVVSETSLQTKDEENSKDGVKDGREGESGDAENVTAGGKASAGGDGVGSDRGIERDVENEDGVSDNAGGEEIGDDGGDGVYESSRHAENDAVDSGKSDVKCGDDAPEAGHSDSFEPLYSGSKSKNKRRPCPYCDFFGVHLDRHLQSIHGDIVTNKEVQMRLVYRADVKEKKKRGETTTISNKHEHLYQCGLPGCHKIVSRMGQHLKRYHKIVNPAKAAEAQKKFTRLSGQRTRRPTSTQTAKPEAASKACKDPKSPESKKGAADDSSEIDQHLPTSTQAAKPKAASKACKDPKSPESKKGAADDSSEIDQHLPTSTKAPKPKSATKVSKDPKSPKSKKRPADDSSDSGSDIIPPTPKRRRQVQEEEEEEASVDKSAHDSDDNASSCSDFDVKESENQRWKEYYQDSSQRDKTVREHFISTFYKYLLHAEGGAHSEEQAMIHTRQVHRILDILDKDGDDLDCLVWRDSLDIWDVFAGPRLKNKELKGETLKVYLRSLEYFAKFVDKNLFFNKDLLSEEKRAAIIRLRTRLPDYRSTIHRRTATQSTTRKVEEAYAKLTPENLRDFQNSEAAKKAIKLLGEAINYRLLTKNEFVSVRDYLLVTTLCENASRPGPLETAKVERFHRAVYTESTQKWALLVDEHKTTRHQGPAELVMDNHLYGYIKLYVEYIRPQFVAPGVQELFIKDDGKPFRKGTIGRRVRETFQAAGVRLDIRVSATSIRKMYSSAAKELSPKKKRLINDHMKHSASTADSSYVIKVNAERSGRAHQLMKNIISGKGEELDDDIWMPKEERVREESAKEESAKEESAKEESAKEGSGKQESIQEAGTADQSCEKEPSSPLPQPPPEKEEAQLSNDDKTVLLCVFDHHIKKGELLVTSEIRAICRADLHLRKLTVDQQKLKKACDFVRYKTNVVRQTMLSGEDDPDPYEFNTVSDSSASGLRRTWDPHSAASLEERMKKFDKMPLLRDVATLFNADNVLKHVLAREGKSRCYEKIKNVFKKRSKQ